MADEIETLALGGGAESVSVTGLVERGTVRLTTTVYDGTTASVDMSAGDVSELIGMLTRATPLPLD